MSSFKYLTRTAEISPDGVFRYHLYRQWDRGLLPMAVIMLNPSTADGTKDDPTVVKVVGFAKNLGYGSVDIVNLNAFRARNPTALTHAKDPIGPQNKHIMGRTLLRVINNGGPVVAAWSALGDPYFFYKWAAEWYPKAGGTVLDHLMCWGIGLTKQPKHPLHLPYSTPLIRLGVKEQRRLITA